MRKFLAFCTVAVSLFLAVPGASAQVFDKITSAQLEGIVKDEGYSSTTNADGDLILKIEGNKALIFRYKDGHSIQFRASFSGTNATLKKVNEWNKSKRFSRTYLDDEGDPVLELDLEFDGGITKARVADFLKTCTRSLDVWKKEVVN